MSTIRIPGQVDDEHRLSAVVPRSVPPGPVTVLIVPATQADDDGDAWIERICRDWNDDLDDSRQDIYTMSDGKSLDEA